MHWPDGGQWRDPSSVGIVSVRLNFPINLLKLMSDNLESSMILHYAAGDLKNELAVTRRMMARAPEKHYAWRPHEKSFSLGDLLKHLSNLVPWGIVNLTEDSYDIGTPRGPRKPLESREALLTKYDERVEKLMGAIENLSTQTLEEPWSLYHGDIKLFTNTKGDVLRHWCISHMVHHRGQLSVYLRLLDVPVPSSYGPTADERG